MYLVRLPEDHPVRWLFLHADPRWQNCPYPVDSAVEYSDQSILVGGPDVGDLSRYFLARSRSEPLKYRRFARDGAQMGPDFQSLPGAAMALSTWSVYADICRKRSHIMQRRRGGGCTNDRHESQTRKEGDQ